MRILTVALIGLASLSIEGCAESNHCFRDSLHSLGELLADPALPVASPAVRWAIASGACEEGIPTLLLAALALHESSFDPRARGPKGGRGLLQVRPSTAKQTAARLGVEWRGEASLSEPFVNAKLGAAYLRTLHEEFGNWEAAMAAYNMGPTRLRRHIDRGRAASSSYAREVVARWKRWKAKHESHGASS